MDFTPAEIEEFKTESLDLLDQAEKSLIALDRGGGFKEHYDPIFRAFHSIKGAAGMMEITPLQAHMHQLENILVGQKDSDSLTKPHIELFLRGMDGCRDLLQGKVLNFVYDLVENKPTGPVPTKETAPVASTSRGRLVVVDDESDVLDMLRDLLTLEGFEVFATNDPTAVMDLIHHHQPHAVLTDMSMPVMSGLDVLTAIRSKNPDLPVIFVSAHLTRTVLMEAIGLGVYGVIEKPFAEDQIFQICRDAVGRAQVMQLFNRSLNLLMYQYSDLAEFLRKHDREDIRETLDREITEMVCRRRELRSLGRAS